MQDKYNDFDLQIRSMLEDAEVKPSRRAWRGISSRLDAAAATGTAAYAAWAKWAGAALACAAVAVGVFFLGTGNQTDYIFESPSRLVSASSPEIVEFIPAPSRLKDLSAQRLALAGLLDDLDLLFQREESPFVYIDTYRHNHLVKHCQSTLEYIEMTCGERVE